MIFVFLTLVIIAIALYVSSYFMSDKIDQLEEQFEQFSISSMQDTYQMKKKIKILEEELLTQDITLSQSEVAATPDHDVNFSDKPLLIQKIYHLHQQGYSVEDIAKQTDLNTDDIRTILKHNSFNS